MSLLINIMLTCDVASCCKYLNHVYKEGQTKRVDSVSQSSFHTSCGRCVAAVLFVFFVPNTIFSSLETVSVILITLHT